MKRTPLKRARKRESAAETKARHAFNAAVWSKGPCIRYPHCLCTYNATCDAHHVLRKQKIRDETLRLPEDERLALMYDPRNGVPVCPHLHARITVRGIQNTRLTRQEVEAKYPEVIEFAAEHGWEHLLERELATEEG